MVKCSKCNSEAMWVSHMHTLSEEDGGGELSWYVCTNLECGKMFLDVEEKIEGGNNNEN